METQPDQDVNIMEEEGNDVLKDGLQVEWAPKKLKTEPDQEPLFITEEGIAVFPDVRQAEWWPYTKVNEPKRVEESNLENLKLEEYLQDASKPLHTSFILPERGLEYTCPVYFGNVDQKQMVLNEIYNSIHPKIQ